MTVGVVMVVRTAVAQVVGFNFLDIVAHSQTNGEISLLQQTNVRKIQIQQVSDKDFKIIIMNMLKDLQEKMGGM